jgi:hypothetical protein
MSKAVTAVTRALGRAIRAVPDSRQKQIDREMANLIMQSGGRLTDSLEFEMIERALGRASHLWGNNADGTSI